MYQAIQVFSQQFPEFGYYWKFEMDFKYTGSHLSGLELLSSWATAQPRKFLSERNARFYLPKVHGDWGNYTAFVADSLKATETVWGPPNVQDINPVGPIPPTSRPEDDTSNWGIGEPADLITFMPQIDIRDTSLVFIDDLGGFTSNANLPRRAAPVFITRCSHLLLSAMHTANLAGQWVSSEMTPETFSLLHGLKSVYVPHPVYMDGPWGAEELDKRFNSGRPVNAGGGGMSVYNMGTINHRVFHRLTYWWEARYAKEVWEELRDR